MMLAAREKCANCEVAFRAAGESKLLVVFSIGAADAVYTVCGTCGERARSEGLSGVPAVASDCRLSPLKRSKTRLLVGELSPSGSLSGVLDAS